MMHPLASGPILVDQVYQRVLEAIADGTLAPGQRVRQGELAERLGVSRQPVSHALHLLKRQGLVQDSGRKGLAVVPLDPLRIRRLYEVRAALDGAAARLAAARAAEDAGGRAALEQALAAGEAIAAAPTPPPVPLLVACDTEFHLALYRLSGNPAFAEITAPHWPHLRRAMAAVLGLADARARFWAEHAAIAARVLAADAAGAEEAARAHALAAGHAAAQTIGSLAAAA